MRFRMGLRVGFARWFDCSCRRRLGTGTVVWKDVMPIVVGFLLTTVLGGLLGVLFQRQSWAHQYRVQLADQELQLALRIFEEISRLLDRRLYRLRLLAGEATPPNTGARSALAESHMDAYRAVLFEWNDGINRNLALVQRYYGAEMRDRLDNTIGAAFVDLGREVEALWKGAGQLRPDLETRLRQLGGLVYHFNLEMIRAVQQRDVGLLGRARPTA
ncbi:hypothetical protein [Embleya hyalina]|uniref:Uncharacterized protein n=1 Tax=Embleya hyalina TaxID=516124 RepID=A0A401YWZ2_9ACTN|nr:hypothetical protein [Embleya hyalina]GCD99134.1 hypothetical protein EHYA_06847 [Embleya hyalina]